MLVTHRGLSGPAVLQASSYWSPGDTLGVDFAPALEEHGRLLDPLLQPGARRDGTALKQALHAVLPQRLAAYLAGRRQHRRLVKSRAGRTRTAPARLAIPSRWYRRVRQGGGDRGGREYRRPAGPDHGSAPCSRPLLYRGSGGCHRASRWLQLPMGVGFGGGGGAECLDKTARQVQVVSLTAWPAPPAASAAQAQTLGAPARIPAAAVRLATAGLPVPKRGPCPCPQ